MRTPPPSPIAQYQDWTDLLFVHYAFEPVEIQRLLPDGLSVDTFPDDTGRERAWLGIVCLLMDNVRPAWAPRFMHMPRFPELNVRTYVHIDGKHPAVWFLSLDATSRLAVWGARQFYHLPYHHARMAACREGGAFQFQSERSASTQGHALRAKWKTMGEPAEAAPRTLDFWLCERYILVADAGSQSDSKPRFRSGAVAHAPYRIQPATLVEWDDHMTPALGLTPTKPVHVCYCPGVETRVWPLNDIV